MTVSAFCAEALQDDAARDLALAVELGDAAALVGRQLDARHVAQQHRRAAIGLEHDLLDVLDATQIAAAAHHELELGELDDAPAHIHIGGADRLARPCASGMSRALQPARVDDDVVLLDEAADARDLGHAFRFGDSEAHLPVLQRAQLGERALRAIDRILVDPADAGRIGSERRRHAGRQLRAAALRYSSTRERAQ